MALRTSGPVGSRSIFLDISTSPDLGALVGRLSLQAGAVRSFREPLEAARQIVIDEVEQHFADEGPGWAKLAPVTQKQREKQGYGATGPILQRTGDLLDLATQKQIWEIDGQEGTATANPRIASSKATDYIYAMNYGIGRVPPRPFLWISSQAEDEIAELFADFYQARVAKATATGMALVGRR